MLLLFFSQAKRITGEKPPCTKRGLFLFFVELYDAARVFSEFRETRAKACNAPVFGYNFLTDYV